MRRMSEQFYADARLYDRLLPGGDQAVAFYRAEVGRQAGSVPELGSGTGRKLIPIASDGHPCTGLDLSPHMLAEARREAVERGVDVTWVPGDMRRFDLGHTFDLVLIAGNSLLHLHRAEDLVSCLRSVRRHLPPGGRFVFDVFSPSVRLLAEADGVRAHARSRAGASSPRRCRCCSRSAASGSSTVTATGHERPSARRRPSSSTSARLTTRAEWWIALRDSRVRRRGH